MKHLIAIILSLIFAFGSFQAAYASDWDVAGKVLTGIEGLRIISGGSIDIIGAFTGINRNKERDYAYNRDYGHNYKKHIHDDFCRVWVPKYTIRKEWVPAHYERARHGKIFINGHYVTYRVENGGYWKNKCRFRQNKH